MFSIYIQVETVGDLNTFNQIWMECWLEKGYMLDPTDNHVDRFIIQDLDNRNVGTLEFRQYYPTIENSINTVFPFQKLEHLSTNPKKVIEIDKVAILKQHRGKNLERLLSLCVNYSEFYEIEYCVVLLERVFYKALKNVYKVPLEKVGDPIYYKGDHVIPTVLFPNLIYSQKELYPWLTSIKTEFNKTPISI